MVYEFKAGTLGTHRVLAPLEFNFEFDSISPIEN